MSIVYKKLDNMSQLNEAKFSSENWYLMCWGMGDATSATLFLESRSPVPYKIICPERNFTGIKFVLDNYVITPHKCQEILIYPDDYQEYKGYPIDQEEVLMSCNGFFPQNSQIMNEAHTYGRLKVAHMPFNNWDFYNNIQNTGILQKIYEYDLNRKKDIEEKTCILFPERGDSYQINDTFWENIVNKMKERGYRVIVNMTKKTNVFKNQKTFNGAEELDKYELQDLLDYVVRHKNLVIIGQCSGIFDLFKYLSCLKLMFFIDYEDSNMPDPTRALYEYCSLGSGPFTKNLIDIKISKFDIRQLDLIVP